VMSLLDFNVVPLWAQKNHFQQFKLTAATNVLNQITDTNISLYQTKSSKLPLIFVSMEGQYNKKTLLALTLTSPGDHHLPIVMIHYKPKEGGGFEKSFTTYKIGESVCNSWNYSIMIYDESNPNIFKSYWSVCVNSKHAFDLRIVKCRDCIDSNMKLIASS